MPSKYVKRILGLLLLGGALFLVWRPAHQPVPIAAAPPAAPAVAAVPAPTPAITLSEADQFKNGVPMKRVVELYERESQRVGKVDPNPKGTQKRLEESARELQPEEIRWLEAQALDGKADADARFFATYLLGLSGKEESIASLKRIALTPLPASKNVRLVEEARALRAQAVEGMCTKDNCTKELATNSLLEVVSSPADDFLRDRAHRCLFACKSGKSTAQQDEEALRKVREGSR